MNKMAIKNHFQLLEINIISAQDLEITSKKMKTYAKAWVHPTRKLSTRVDAEGQNNPTWNDKFVFRVDDQYLRQDTSSVMIEIYGVSWLRDKLVGTVHVLVGNLIPPARPHVPSHQIGMRFVALQVRRPSGRPQGILNIGVTLLDSSMRSMPLYRQMSKSAVGFHDLMLDNDDPQLQSKYLVDNDGEDEEEDEENKTPVVKPILRRSRSERSERVTFDNASIAAPKSSIVGYNPKPKKLEKESSILSISDVNYPYNMKMKGKASSVISGAEPKRRVGRKGKASSVISDSIISTTFNNVKNGKLSKPTEVAKEKEKEKEKELDAGHEVEKLVEKIEKGEYPVPIDQSPPNNVAVDEKSIGGSPVKEITPNQTPKLIPKPLPKLNGYDYGGVKGMRGGNGKYVMGAPYKANSVWSDSEVGPSPSEVAAAMMMERKYPLEEERSSVLDGWSVDESVEGLRSKLDRWRTELPPLYDRGGFSSSYRSSTQYSRKHSASGGRGRHAGPGLFSCFGNICGIECQCVCGQPPARKGQRFHSPSTGSRSFL